MPTNKQERERARRNLQQQLERRREAEARRRKTTLGITVVATLVVIGVVVALVIGLSGGDSSTPSAAGSPSASASATTAGTTGPCGYKTADRSSNPNLLDTGLPPDPDPTPTLTRTLTFASNLGNIVVSLDGAAAPCNVQSITYLAQKGFYDKTSCPRSVDSGIFVVQCGDPSGTTSGGPSYTTKDENLTAAKYTAGAVAMANGGANTNGSQFFFITADSQLGQNYTVIGQVTQGLDLLQKVVAAGNDGSNQAGGGKPNQALDFTTVTVTPQLDLAGASSSPSEGASEPATVSGSPSVPGAVTGSPAQ